MSKRINHSIDGTQLWYSTNNGAGIAGEIPGATHDILDSDPLYGAGGGHGHPRPSQVWYMFNFQSELVLDKVGVMHISTDDKALLMEISNNSTDGLDGAWTTVRATAFIPMGSTIQYYDITPIACTWFRITKYSLNLTGYTTTNRIHLFGEYSTPNFEFWDADATAKVDADYQVLDDAVNSADYSDFEAFTIKNTDTNLLTHSYTVTVVAKKYGGDSTVTNYCRLSDKGDLTVPGDKVTSLTINNLAAGAFTDELRLYCDILEAQNAADGYHYWYVKVVETP